MNFNILCIRFRINDASLHNFTAILYNFIIIIYKSHIFVQYFLNCVNNLRYVSWFCQCEKVVLRFLMNPNFNVHIHDRILDIQMFLS